MGLYPAWQSSRTELAQALKDGGRVMSGSRGQQRVRRGLVAAQVALSVLLLAGAALLLASFNRLRHEKIGIRPEGIWVAGIGLPAARYGDERSQARFVERLRSELQATPGVESAAITDLVPLSGGVSHTPYARPDVAPPPLAQRPIAVTHAISAGYLRTFGIPLLSGRDLAPSDDLDHPQVVLISQSGARAIFPGLNPIGRQLLLGGKDGTGTLTEVVGVVDDVRSEQVAKKNEIEFYRPFAQRPNSFLTVALRGPGRPELLLGTARAALDQVDRQLPFIQPQTMEQVIRDSLGQQRLTMTLLGAFALLALLLAVVGIYGGVAYTVEQRTGEIGLRMALGAQARDVLRLIISQGMQPVVIGLLAGLGTTLALGGLLASQLYEVSARNPALLASTTFLLGAVALAACLIPARRATRVDPIIALRYE
jgi:putative ABC transport system permease protein